MNDCTLFEPLLEKQLNHETTRDEEQRLQEHLAQCEACAGMLALHERLEQWEFTPEEPDSQDLAAVRSAVLRTARQEQSPVTHLPKPRRAFPVFAQLAAGFLLLFVGFFFGQSGDPSDDRSRRQTTHPLEVELERIASGAGQESLDVPPYAVSNLTMQSIDEDTVALSFDLATRLEVSRHPSDPFVDELLAQSILNTAPIGPRLEALSYAADRMDPKIRDAVIQVVRYDPSLPVRLSALESLTRYPSDEVINETLLHVLEQEESTQMRLLAIDSLTRRQIPPQRLEAAIERARPEVAPALKVRAGDYLRPL